MAESNLIQSIKPKEIVKNKEELSDVSKNKNGKEAEPGKETHETIVIEDDKEASESESDDDYIDSSNPYSAAT